MEFLWRSRHFVPRTSFGRPALLYHTARIQQLAAEWINIEGIDVIHSHFGWPEGFGGLLTKAVTGTPVIATMRGMDVLVERNLGYGLRLSPFYDNALRMLLRNADRTTHVSDFIRKHAIELGATTATARTVRKGVDCDHFKPADETETQPDCPIVLAVGGLVNRKGFDWILRALSRLVDSHRFAVAIAGDGPERAALEDLCNQLGLSSRTTFHGDVARHEIQDLFSRCDVFVLGSICEGSGNVLLEALASGKPVVCTDSGGPSEYVTDGVSGFVVPVADPAAMASRIAQLLDDPPLRRELGRTGRNHATTRYAYKTMLDEIISTYRHAIAGQDERTDRTG